MTTAGMLNTDSQYNLFTPLDADRIAAEMTEQNGADGWIYVAVHDPKATGLSYIEVREDGEVIGRI